MKTIAWHGSSYDELRAFPVDARRDAGFQLDKIQHGLDPDDWKPMPTVGAGVREIRIREAFGSFRILYVTHVGDCIHVLHAFQKKTQKTRQTDIELAKIRFRALMRATR